MIVLSKKKILVTISTLSLMIVFTNILLTSNSKEKLVQTANLPVTNKVIVLDARTSVFQMNGAESRNRYFRSGNKFKNCIKSSKFARTKWRNGYINKVR